MIWYDSLTHEPVAPGSCEDGGSPSIEGYYCRNCKQDVDIVYKMYCVLCEKCRMVLLNMG